MFEQSQGDIAQQLFQQDSLDLRPDFLKNVHHPVDGNSSFYFIAWVGAAEQVEAKGEILVGHIQEICLFEHVFRQEADHMVDKVTVGIKDNYSIALFCVLADQIRFQQRFPLSCGAKNIGPTAPLFIVDPDLLPRSDIFS